MEYYDIVVCLYAANRPGPTSHSPMDHAAFAGVSTLSSRPEGPGVIEHIQEPGWGSTVELATRKRKVVTIELPDGLSVGPYYIANVYIDGLHSDHAASDGMGKAAFAWCNISAKVDGDSEAAIDAAIASGITLSVPQPDGSRKNIPATICAVSELKT